MAKRVLAVDQSYSRLGIAVAERDAVLVAFAVDLTKLESRTQKRLTVAATVKQYTQIHRPALIVVERVRLFTGNRIAAGTIMQLASLVAVIIDAAWVHGEFENGAWVKKPVPVYSADTRAWKKAVLGDSSADKAAAVEWLKGKGIDAGHDAADAAAMACYAFMPDAKFKREE